jgi:hypothetical protein
MGLITLLRLLLPSAEMENDGIVWPELQVIKLSHVGAEEIDGICEIITHRSSCSQPINTIIFDPVSLEKHLVEVEWMNQHVHVRRGSPYLTLSQSTSQSSVTRYD